MGGGIFNNVNVTEIYIVSYSIRTQVPTMLRILQLLFIFVVLFGFCAFSTSVAPLGPLLHACSPVPRYYIPGIT